MSFPSSFARGKGPFFALFHGLASCWVWGIIVAVVGGDGGSHRTNWVVFEHAHGRGDSGTGEGVEVTGLGHGKEAHEDNAGLDCCGVFC